MGDLFGLKNHTRGKYILNPAFNNSRKNDFGLIEKRKAEQIRNTVLHEAENLRFVPWTLTKSHLWISSLSTATNCKK